MTNIFTFLKEEAPFFLHLTTEHLLLSLLAIVIATLIGVVLGVFISEYRKYAAWLLAAVNVLYTIPSIALLGFFITITGVGNLTALIALILYALLPIIRSTYIGITQINPLIIEAAEAMGSTRWQLLWRIKLPLALPVLMQWSRSNRWLSRNFCIAQRQRCLENSKVYVQYPTIKQQHFQPYIN